MYTIEDLVKSLESLSDADFNEPGEDLIRYAKSTPDVENVKKLLMNYSSTAGVTATGKTSKISNPSVSMYTPGKRTHLDG